MSEIRSILAATDFSVDAERASRRAALLAGILGARLELLHVVSGSAMASLAGLAPSLGNVGERLLDDARRTMDAASASLPGVEARVETGEIPERILQAAASHDLLVLGARGAGSLQEAFLGTTAGRLLLGAKCAILVVKAGPQAGYARVIVPCEYAPPARRALELALKVAPGARITMLHAHEGLDAQQLLRASVKREDIENLRAAAEARTLAWLAGLGNGLEGAGTLETKVKFASPRRAILEVAQEEGADLIVMGKQGRSKPRDMFLGSCTRQIVDQATCDVLVAPSS
jgi:nucleotide-binding universal stress UspA family protein